MLRHDRAGVLAQPALHRRGRMASARPLVPWRQNPHLLVEVSYVAEDAHGYSPQLELLDGQSRFAGQVRRFVGVKIFAFTATMSDTSTTPFPVASVFALS